MRVFKTKSFAVASRKASISDAELCEAIQDVFKGRGVNLGGGVWKKRLNTNLHRSIILAKAGQHWVYQFLFAKSDQANISQKELVEFKKLALAYARLNQDHIKALIDTQAFMEICNGEAIQK
ncbi:type II toxin-antitoxin system RelE/ParE family toxin [Pseudomonas sp. NPDC007930]|uniref:type II toxin-antitoxin system RelE/ParE family toxin n=1 Tax=Pseudomonas sp. NPDC007930 TaxID=3364417 RepID=UPI0036E802BF